MGNHASYGCGYAVAHCGCTNACGFENTTRAIMQMNGIEPWSSKALIMEHLELQEKLARTTPLRKVDVQDGLNHFSDKARNWLAGGMTEDVFKRTAIGMLNIRNIPHTPAEDHQLSEIFHAMDYDGNGRLSIGEWAGGMTVFFKGTREDCVRAVFTVLDADGNQILSRSELGAYLQPFVKAMIPEEAASLRPLLIKKCTEDIFEDMAHHLQDEDAISSDDMLEWMRAGNNIIDKLVHIIDPLVYDIWFKQKNKQSWGLGSHHSYDPVSHNMASSHADSVFGGGSGQRPGNTSGHAH